jgi:hypothetical protein
MDGLGMECSLKIKGLLCGMEGVLIAMWVFVGMQGVHCVGNTVKG